MERLEVRLEIKKRRDSIARKHVSDGTWVLICISGQWAGWDPTPVCKSKSSSLESEVL